MKLVLFVEDEYGNAEVLQMLLEAEGYRVSHAANGRAALELLAGEKPAVILSDFMMPHMTGGELGQAIRSDPALRDIPFIMLSGTLEPVIRASFDDYDAFVAKPFAADQLLALLADLASTGRLKPPRGNPTPSAEEIDSSMRQLLGGINFPPP